MSPDVTQIIRSWFSPGWVHFVPLTLNQCWIQPGPQRLWGRSQWHPSNDTFQSRGWTHSEHELWIRSQRLPHWRLMWTRWRTNWSWTDEDTRDQVQLDCVSREKADQVIRRSGDQSVSQGGGRHESEGRIKCSFRYSECDAASDGCSAHSQWKPSITLIRILCFFRRCLLDLLHWTQYLFLLKEKNLRTNQNEFSRRPKS